MGDKNLTYTNRAAMVIAEPSNAVGRIKKTYGSGKSEERGGALLVMLYDNFPMSSFASSKKICSNAESLWVEIDSLAVPLFIGSLNRIGGAGKSTKAIVWFEDFEREEDVEQLVGKVLYMESEFHQENDQADEEMEGLNAWIGYELTDRITGRRGIVAAFYDYRGNPVLGVNFDGQEVLVPAAEGLIEVVSVRRKKLQTQLPEGIFSL